MCCWNIRLVRCGWGETMLLEKPWPRGALEEEVKWKNGKERKVKEAYALLKRVVRWALLEVFSPEWCHGGQHRINHSLSPTLCCFLSSFPLTWWISHPLCLFSSLVPIIISISYQEVISAHSLNKIISNFCDCRNTQNCNLLWKIVIYNGCPPPPYTHTPPLLPPDWTLYIAPLSPTLLQAFWPV